jgi:uncharacterized protein YunC (DUF1805 family)
MACSTLKMSMAEHHKNLMGRMEGIRNLDALKELPQSMSSARTSVNANEVGDHFMRHLTIY